MTLILKVAVIVGLWSGVLAQAPKELSLQQLYEHHRCRRRVTLVAGFPVAHAERCDILEQPLETESCTLEGNAVSFEITPYRIVTLRLIPREGSRS